MERFASIIRWGEEYRSYTRRLLASTFSLKDGISNTAPAIQANSSGKRSLEESSKIRASPAKKMKLADNDDPVQIEDFLDHVLSWQLDWLQNAETPPILKDLEVVPLSDSYSTFQDYCKAMFPLLLCETWEELSFEYLNRMKQRNDHQPAPFWFKSSKSVPGSSKLSIVRLQTAVDSRAEPVHFRDDLLRLNYDDGGDSSTTSLLGIVHRIQKFLSDAPEVIPAVKEYTETSLCSRRSRFLVYELCVLARRPLSLSSGFIVDSKCLANLARALNRARALCSLESSSVSLALLRADPDDAIFRRYPTKAQYARPIHGFDEQTNAINQVTSVVLDDEPRLCLVQGAPGTGKTHAAVGIVKNTLSSTKESTASFKLLVCAASSSGCDELTRRLMESSKEAKAPWSGLSVVRVGRCSHDCDPVNLERLAAERCRERARKKVLASWTTSFRDNYEGLKFKQKSVSEQLEKILKKYDRQYDEEALKDLESRLEYLNERTAYFESLMIKKYEEDTSFLEKRKDLLEAREAVLREANVVVCSLNTCGSRALDCLRSSIRLVIVDEADQWPEIDSLTLLRFGCERMILLGDSHTEQSHPTLLSQNDLALSLFERLCRHVRPRTFDIQHRMNSMCKLSFYQSQLKSSAACIRYDGQSYVYDVSNGVEEGDEADGSIFNPAEAVAAASLCKQASAKHTGSSIGVITPYRRQSEYIRRLLDLQKTAGVEVGTVNSFQGREKDIIILSTVRANPVKKIGFLANRQQMKVALTRAKCVFYMVCHVETLQNDPDWAKYIADVKKLKLLRNYHKMLDF